MKFRYSFFRLGDCSIAILLGGILLAPSAGAHPYVDPLTDWSNVLGHSDNMRIDTMNQTMLGPSRATRTNANDGYFIYKIEARSFSANVYYYDHYEDINVFGSPDGQNWTQVTTNITGPAPGKGTVSSSSGPTRSSWASDIMTGSLPPDSHYVMFQIKANKPTELNQAWAPEIGEVQFSTDSIINPNQTVGSDLTPSPNGPQGLTVMAASSQAFVNWYPLKGAVSYTVKRSSDYSASYTSIANNVTSTSFADNGLSPGTRYNYAIIANMSDGSTLCSQIVPRIPDSGSVVFNDPLTDWSNVNDHSDGLAFAKQAGNIAAVRRTGADTQTITYNLPGSVKFAANVYYQGDIAGQFSVDASIDGSNWTPIKMTNSPPVEVGANWYLSVVSADGRLPDGTNFVRLNLEGGGFTDSPQVGAIRMTYGSTKLTHMVLRTRTQTEPAETDTVAPVPDAPPWNDPGFHAAVRDTAATPHVTQRGWFWILRYQQGNDIVYTGTLVPLTGDKPNPLNETTVAEFSYHKGSGLWSADVYDKSKISAVTVPTSYLNPATDEAEGSAAGSSAGTPRQSAHDGNTSASQQAPTDTSSSAPQQASGDGTSSAPPQATADDGPGTTQETASEGGSGSTSSQPSVPTDGTP